MKALKRRFAYLGCHLIGFLMVGWLLCFRSNAYQTVFSRSPLFVAYYEQRFAGFSTRRREFATHRRWMSTSSPDQNWSSLTVSKLKDELKKRGLKVSGLKAELVSRLRDFEAAQVGVPISPPCSEEAEWPDGTEKRNNKKQKISANTMVTGRKTIPQSGVAPRAAEWRRRRRGGGGGGGRPAAAAADAHLVAVAWNVAGARALLRKPEELRILKNIVRDLEPDVFCLQETKLQTMHVLEVKAKFEEVFPQYESYWVCSEARKGYSGNAVFLHRDLPPPLSVSTAIGDPEGDLEGRWLGLELPGLHLASVYVPNSGDKLARLGYRVGTWDPSLRRYLGQLDAQKPVVVLGDFNVCHLDADFYNPEDPRTKKQSATTPEERSSFSELLDAGFIDTFRWKHPEASGAYSYWSQRARNRPYNRGLRIDYALVSQRLENRIIDAFILHEETEGRNDHCPIALILKQDQSPW